MRKRFFEGLGLAVCSLLLTLPMAAADNAHTKTATRKTQSRSAWPPETLSGTIVTVDPAQKLVIVKGSDGVPFDMVLNSSTLIESGKHKLKLDQLRSSTDKSVSVRFVPERSGDIARSIQIMG